VQEDALALADFESAIRLAPNSPRGYASRAAYWLSERNFERAIDDCDAALKIDPQNELFSLRGDAFMQKGEYDRAVADYDRAKRFDATVAQAYLRYAESLEQAGKSQDAVAAKARAIELDPTLRGEGDAAAPTPRPVETTRTAIP
jgi:tetratricopeptide (TPR) repeat protein